MEITNTKELNSIHGGAFNFYTRDGQEYCYIEDRGTFYCNEDASKWIAAQMSAPGASLSNVADEAIKSGKLWS